MSVPTRRTFLQATLAAAASLFLPRFLTAKGNPKSFWFLHAETGESWPVGDPVLWSLENARMPILERASKGLLKLTHKDGNRIIRLVVRRCKLDLLELRPGQVVVNYWGQNGYADLRPFFKQHCLARKEIKVVLIDRKKEVSTTQNGDDLLYGERLGEKFPLGLYLNKFQRRFEQQPDD